MSLTNINCDKDQILLPPHSIGRVISPYIGNSSDRGNYQEPATSDTCSCVTELIERQVVRLANTSRRYVGKRFGLAMLLRTSYWSGIWSQGAAPNVERRE